MKSLFDTTNINKLVLKNRLVRSATCENMMENNGHLTEKLFKVYENLAQGQVGLIITGNAIVLEEEKYNPTMMRMYNDSFIDEYKKLTDMVHSYGSKIVLQMVSVGDETDYAPENRKLQYSSIVPEECSRLLCPSIIPGTKNAVIAQEMSKDDIKFLTGAFGDAAERGKTAGFDGIQIHGAHSFVLSKFLTPYYNRRTDEYGGSIENRARIIFEVYDEIRKRVGEDYPILIKINCEDFIENGMTFDECKYVCAKLAKRGIDAIEISGGMACRTGINSPEKQGYFKTYAEVIANTIDKPVISVGGFRSIEVIEKVLNETKIEYISLSRPLLREPDLIKRWQEGYRGKSKCVSCNGCFRKDQNSCIFNMK